MAKDTFYFSHDYNARNDLKIKRLLSKHGMEGYGIFWSIIEDLYNNTNVLRLDYETLSFDLRCSSDLVKSIVNDFDLFAIEGDIFGSHSVQRRLEERNAKSEKARESVLKRWNKDTNVLPMYNDSNTIKESIVNKEIKEKEINEIIVVSSTVLDFDAFWDLYDKKVGDKTKLSKKFSVISEDDREKMLSHIPEYKKSQPDKKFRKDPATYLNNKSWNDEIIVQSIHKKESNQQAKPVSHIQRIIEM